MKPRTNKATVLVVDDNPDNIELVHQVLEDQYQILTATNGADCLTLASQRQPDLILLDVMMPVMDGYETLSALQADEHTRDIPVIFLTARYKDIDRIVKGLELGAFDYITKPFDDDILLARVGVAARVKYIEDAYRQQKAELEGRVTELTAAQTALHTANLELDCANKELQAFSYSVSHDLRAPLRSIDGFSQMLLEDNEAQLDTQGKHYLQRVCSGVQHMSALIDDLLLLSQAASGSLTRHPVDLGEIAATTLAQLHEENPERRVDIHIDDGMTASADPVLIGTVLANLLDNAWKYSGKQGQPRIDVGQQQEDDTTTFYVRDNGVGFDMQHGEKLFEAFHRLHNKDEFPGTGIGLATVQRIIHRHGGRIWAESAPGQGSSFFFTLPPANSHD